jgi:phosphopantetheine adenylyltransferase
MIFYPGSFKPPHKGHFQNLLYLLNKYPKQNITIIISKKMRPLNPDFYDYDKLNSENLKKLCNKYNIIYNTKKESIIHIKEYILKTKYYINAEKSLFLWNYYITNLLNIEQQKKIKVIISYLHSPILTIFSLLKQKKYQNKSEKIYLVKSEKNKDNKRFNSFTNKNVIITPSIKNIHSKDFRKNLYLKKSIQKFLPKGINQKNISF